MKLEETWQLATTPDKVYGLATNAEFQEAKAKEGGALKQKATVTPSGQGAVVVLERTSPSDTVPELLKKFVGATTDSVDTVTWGAAAADGSRTGDIAIEIKGAPLSGKGTVNIAPDGSGTRITVKLDLKAKVPLIGGKVESLSAPEIVAAIKAEQRAGQQWVADGKA